FSPDKYLLLLPRTAQDTLDFTGPKINLGSKMILDATSEGDQSGSRLADARSNNTLRATPRMRGSREAGNLKKIDERIFDCRIWEDALFAVKIKRGPDDAAKEILKELLQRDE